MAPLLHTAKRILGGVSEFDLDESYRTCPQCGCDLDPEPFTAPEGVRIAFACEVHGIHTVVDPFEADG